MAIHRLMVAFSRENCNPSSGPAFPRPEPFPRRAGGARAERAAHDARSPMPTLAPGALTRGFYRSGCGARSPEPGAPSPMLSPNPEPGAPSPVLFPNAAPGARRPELFPTIPSS